jgi:hypothetical protein
MTIEDWDRFDDYGKQKVYPTRRPENTTTLFVGAGDHVPVSTEPAVIGGGATMKFSMTSADTTKESDLVFTEDIYVKGGYAIFENAPYGSYYDIEIHHPIGGKVGAFAVKCPMMDTGMYDMDPDDVAILPQGMIMKVRITNSSPATAFKVVGRLEMFRTNTV